MKELLTEKQKARKERDLKIAVDFRKMVATYPNASTSLIIEEMAKKGGSNGVTSKSGLRSSLMRVGAL